MSDTPAARMRELFEDIRRISEEAGLYGLEEPSIEEITQALDEVRQEMGEQK